eukprot:2565359-Pyramimonas_sp.AAC.3
MVVYAVPMPPLLTGPTTSVVTRSTCVTNDYERVGSFHTCIAYDGTTGRVRRECVRELGPGGQKGSTLFP